MLSFACYIFALDQVYRKGLNVPKGLLRSSSSNVKLLPPPRLKLLLLSTVVVCVYAPPLLPAATSVVIVVVIHFLIPLPHLSSGTPVPRNFSSSLVLLPPPVTIVRIVRSAAGRRSSSAWWVPKVESLVTKPPLGVLDHGMPDLWPVEPRAALKSGFSVAMQPAVIPMPTSTVVQIAKSVVR